jgi:hypothetical protein
MKGKQLKEAASMREEDILEVGSNAEELCEKGSALLELLRNGVSSS